MACALNASAAHRSASKTLLPKLPTNSNCEMKNVWNNQMFNVLGSACVRALHVMMVRVKSELVFFLCAISTRAFDRLPPRHFYRGFVFVNN